MTKGFIPIRRSLFKHFLFNEHRVFNRFEAWLDLIQLASFLDGQTDMIKGKMITRNRGEVVASIRWLASRWNWSNHKTFDFIEVLRSQGMVVVGKENGITRLTLANYDTHNFISEEEKNSNGNAKGNGQKPNGIDSDQNQGTGKGTQTGTPGEQSGNTGGTNYNKDNNLNKKKKGEAGAGAPSPPGDGEGKLKERQEAMIRRRDEFYQQLVPSVATYPKAMIRDFFNYWSEANASRTKMKFELERTWDTKLRLTTWENKELLWKKGDSSGVDQSRKKAPAGLSKLQEDINYVYGRYLEDEITIRSVDWSHFNEIVKAELIIFSPDEVEDLRAKAAAYLKENSIEATPESAMNFAKRFGVLEFFSRLKAQGKEIIFTLPGNTQ